MEIKMRINKVLLTFLIVTFSWFFTLTASAQSNDPVVMLKSIANNMIAGLKANKATLKSKPDIVYSLAYRYVVPHADLSEMAKQVLSPQVWNNATPAQRMEFEKEFTATLIRTYASGLSSYEDQVVTFYPLRGGANGKTVEVSSEISGSQGQPIHVTYRLMRSGSMWKLYDMSVEGVSMLDSFREQFADILSQGNMESLLKKLSGHNKGLS